ncbi:MAG: hypothetical protein P1T08_05475 [Acidimicrobiia bacterium]|nr:hypothetical protein [Acidimicrobiia bacterium]
MTEFDIDAVLARCERQLESGDSIDLGAEGFWKAVGRIKRDPTLVDRYADQVGRIDRRAFEAWVFRSFPIAVGEALLWFGTVAGLVIIAAGYYVDEPLNAVLLLAGTGALLVTTHGLGHLLVGRAMGMRFTHWFIAGLSRPQPGVKTDYATYLRVPARRRAWMHASGALVTKALPFLLLGAAWGMEAPVWSWIVLIGLGILLIISDVTMSTKQSDWKKFSREMAIARALADKEVR